MTTGKASWFGGPNDPSAGGTPASGLPITVPGIAVYNQATLGGFWLLHLPNGRQAVVKQTDIGPAPYTGRTFDLTYSLLPRVGYSESNFPTDATITGQYLGRTVPPNLRSLVIGPDTPTSNSTGAGAGAGGSSSSTGAYGGLGGWLLKALLTLSLLAGGAVLTGVGVRSFVGAHA